MRTPSRNGRIFALAALTAAALSGAAALAQAAPAGHLNLSVTDAAGSTAAATLDCPQGTGNHRYGDEACRQLAAAGGDPDRLTGVPGMVCTKQYEPVQATVTGTWNGKPLHWQHTFGNSCELHAATGAVFDLS
ncbi:SSI family serine proteinase inhibitor [Amycolatopsis anabasis]|uniref:SSI family serine proteinase inhibitor n=1 Tax=Amycolatopsis anabasis TaxID=1840409 RepID=UPI00131A6EAD|nr:SSI family serine proteinase inhibitor [Amycolatopsis anabasis]